MRPSSATPKENRCPSGSRSQATDRRRYEKELLGARELARAGERSAADNLQREHETAELREQFIAVLGHDLRNPLASISAGARILDRTAQTEKEHQVIAMMQTTVMRMAGLIDPTCSISPEGGWVAELD